MCCSHLARAGSWGWSGPEAAPATQELLPHPVATPSSRAGDLGEYPHLCYPTGHLRLLSWWLAWNCAEAQITKSSNWEAGGGNPALSADLATRTTTSSREVWFYNDPERFVRAHLHSHSYMPERQHHKHNFTWLKKHPTSKTPEKWLNASRISTYFLKIMQRNFIFRGQG